MPTDVKAAISSAVVMGRRFWWILILGPLVAGLSAYLISSAMTPIYQSSLTLLIEENQLPVNGSDYNSVLAAQQLATTYSHLVTAPSVLNQTIAKLGLPLTPAKLASEISVSPIRDTQLLRVTVDDPNPHRAADVANAVGDIFIKDLQQRQSAASGTSQQDVNQNVDATKKQIDATTAQITSLQQRPDASSSSVQAQISTLQAQLAQERDAYSNLLQVQQQLALAASQTTQVSVGLPAQPASSPVRPRTTLNTGLGVLFGLIIASGLVALISYLDDTVKDNETVRRLTDKPALGWIPIFGSTNGLETLQNPRSSSSDGYRSLRTNLQFATIGQPVRSAMVTSARPGDGKTATVGNLAVVLAQAGQSVILVDADLRKPRVHRLFDNIRNRSGLTDLLLSDTSLKLDSLLQPTQIPGLRVLTTGPLPPNPTDVLNSDAMGNLIAKLESSADIVLFDTAPLAVSDSLVLAGRVDGVLLVALTGETRGKELMAAVEDLGRTSTPLLGIVLNKADAGKGSYYYYYYSYQHDSPDGDSTPGPNGTGERIDKARRRLGGLLPSRGLDVADRGD